MGTNLTHMLRPRFELLLPARCRGMTPSCFLRGIYFPHRRGRHQIYWRVWCTGGLSSFFPTLAREASSPRCSDDSVQTANQRYGSVDGAVRTDSVLGGVNTAWSFCIRLNSRRLGPSAMLELLSTPLCRQRLWRRLLATSTRPQSCMSLSWGYIPGSSMWWPHHCLQSV
jgi:hypothetical protein